MATYLSIVNGVLRRLRENTVSSFDETEYSTLISKFVNDAKREVEDAWDWTALREDLTFNTVAGTTSYIVTDSTQRTTIRQVLNPTRKCILRRASHSFIDRNLHLGTAVSASPNWYRMKGVDTATGSLKMDLYPTPDATYTILLPSVVPQDDLTDSTTVLQVPFQPVEMLAWAFAVRERGEAGGTSASESSEMALNALRNAVILDTSYVEEELVWRLR
jgi:hypothetical protein